ncbi:MAG: FecR domain-containing protein [Armatimonadetes bacterium]|nr:FecR domain-containing protein [Armatimonadota bacterium]
MSSVRKCQGFTMIEILVTLGIIVVLAAIVFPVFATARESARVVRCVSNLQQISLATKVYYHDCGGPPMTRLPESLGPYVKGDEVFVCPDDPEHEDSYSAFFVGRPSPAEATQFLVGCPRHSHGQKGATAGGQGKSNVGVAGNIVWDSGKPHARPEEISAGQVVEEGTLTFADGSTVEISKKLTCVVLSSVTEDNILHSVVYVRPSDKKGEIRVAVTPGANFEVISPEICAAVRGTKFSVEVEKAGGQSRTTLVVTEGGVEVNSRVRKVRYVVKKGHWGFEEQSALAADSKVTGPWGY